MFPVFNFPPLNDWLSNAAGILLLSVFIDFTNVATRVHIYEVMGISHSLWHWPITPASAQLLLGLENVFGGCCLDRGGETSTLQCLDTQLDDSYPCTSPFTVQLATRCSKMVERIVMEAALESKSSAGRPTKLGIVHATLLCDVTPNQKRFIIAYIRWFLWMVLFTISIMSQLHFAAIYFIAIVLTGITIRYTHGHHLERLLDTTDQAHTQPIVTADDMNSIQWIAYQGAHKLIDSLLNKPLYCAMEVSPNICLQHYILVALIAGQWGMVVVASAHQDWNELVIAFWIVFWAANAVQDWLFINSMRLQKIEVELSNRRVILSLLVALNKDRDGHGHNSKGLAQISVPSGLIPY